MTVPPDEQAARDPDATTSRDASSTAARAATRASDRVAGLAAPRDDAALREADRRVLWHPFTQMRGWMTEDFPVIRAAEGAELIDADGNRFLDGVSSLWCALHGHRVPEIDAAVREQLDKVAHSTLLGLGGEPSIELAEALVDVAPGDLTRVFYSDSGSTAVEIALKMAFQFWRQTEGVDAKRTRFLCLEDAYHGDTIGSVSVGGIDLFHSIFRPLLFQATQLPVPRGPTADVRAADTDRCLAALDALLAREGDTFAAVVLEPGVQGAAGIRVFPEGFTRAIVERCRARGILVVVDEVATGFGRGDTLFACEREGVEPDLLCLAKGLSGGYLPLAATLSTERIFDGFGGRYDEFRTFFHGHTFTGNALACAAGLASLRLCTAPGFLERTRALTAVLARELAALRDHPHVLEVRGYGSMFGVEVVRSRTGGAADGSPRNTTGGAAKGPATHDVPEWFPTDTRIGHRVCLEARARGVIIRPLGDTVVLMPPFVTTEAQAVRLIDVLKSSLDAAVAEVLS